jgi:transcriptional regulator with XRE-family HTH domain
MTTSGQDPDNASLSVGALIRRYRLMGGLTQEELGEKADLSVRAVRNLEHDKVERPRRSTLRRLAPALGLNATDTARLVAAARTLPHGIPAGPGAETTTLPVDWLGLQPILDQLTTYFGQHRVVLVRVSYPLQPTTATPNKEDF